MKKGDNFNLSPLFENLMLLRMRFLMSLRQKIYVRRFRNLSGFHLRDNAFSHNRVSRAQRKFGVDA